MPIQVNQPGSSVAAQVAVVAVSCSNGANGTALASAIGGTAPYAYSWSNGQSTAFMDSLIAGVYTVIVSDSNGCATSQSILINQPLPIVLQSVNTNNICYGQALGTVNVTAIGGTTPYSYLWNNGSQNDSIGNNSCSLRCYFRSYIIIMPSKHSVLSIGKEYNKKQ